MLVTEVKGDEGKPRKRAQSDAREVGRAAAGHRPAAVGGQHGSRPWPGCGRPQLWRLTNGERRTPGGLATPLDALGSPCHGLHGDPGKTTRPLLPAAAVWRPAEGSYWGLTLATSRLAARRPVLRR